MPPQCLGVGHRRPYPRKLPAHGVSRLQRRWGESSTLFAKPLFRGNFVELGGIEPPSNSLRTDPIRPFPLHTYAGVPAGRLPVTSGGSRIVFPNRQRSFSPSAVFAAVIPHFCCRAVMDWPRAAFLLTMTLHSSDRNQAARANCSSAILWFPRFTSLRNSGRKLEQRY